jgi:DNA sulfur modification protein DndD
MNIEKIYINDKFKIIIEGKNEKTLDITLLSAGQKQILSFILITTILEFNRFVDFIFIDTPFGRLSNKNRDFIFNNYYLNFSHLTLLVTSSEYEYLKKQHIDFKLYEIIRDEYGSKICEVKNG